MKFAIALSPLKSKFGPLFFSGNLNEGIEKAAEYGYDGIEISVKDPALLDKEQIRSQVQQHGLEVVTLATGQSFIEEGLGLCSAEQTELSKTVKRLCDIVDLAQYLGSRGVTVGGIRGKSGGVLNDTQMVQNGARSVKAVCQYAKQKNVEIYMEPVNHFEVSYIHTAKHAVEFIEMVDEENVGILLDSYHINIEEASIGDSVITSGSRTKLVHFADNNRLVPGKGFFNFSEMIHCLNAVGYTGYISIEALPLPDSDTAAKQAKKYFETI